MGVTKKSERFRRWQHFVRYLVTHNYIYVHLCKTKDMLANPLTKTCDKSEFYLRQRQLRRLHGCCFCQRWVLFDFLFCNSAASKYAYYYHWLLLISRVSRAKSSRRWKSYK